MTRIMQILPLTGFTEVFTMEKPIVLVIMDGVGKGDGGSGYDVVFALTPTLDDLLATCLQTYLKAHGTLRFLLR